MADILIRGISLPEDELKNVSLWIYGDGRVYVSKNASAASSKRLQDLAIPLPEGHGRLGDLDALSKEFEHLASLDWNQKAAPYSWAYAYSEAQASVDDSPTIIEADLEWKMKNCCCFSNTDQAEGGNADGN